MNKKKLRPMIDSRTLEMMIEDERKYSKERFQEVMLLAESLKTKLKSS